MKPLTHQQIFDTVVTHLRKQGKKALHKESNVCAYRSPDGLKCAAGVLIPDELYEPRMENSRISALVSNPNRTASFAEAGINSSNLVLIQALQDVHDQQAVSQWEYEFIRVADDFKLTYKEPEHAAV